MLVVNHGLRASVCFLRVVATTTLESLLLPGRLVSKQFVSVVIVDALSFCDGVESSLLERVWLLDRKRRLPVRLVKVDDLR